MEINRLFIKGMRMFLINSIKEIYKLTKEIIRKNVKYLFRSYY